jgi:hypothetical protein
MRFYWLVMGILAVWRVTHLLSVEDGPWNILIWIRRKIASGFWASLVNCFYCLSLWVAVPFAFFIGENLKDRSFLWLAFSAGAILIERVTSREAEAPIYFEPGGHDSAVLREGENRAVGGDPTASARD